jgi:hypothetical protein
MLAQGSRDAPIRSGAEIQGASTPSLARGHVKVPNMTRGRTSRGLRPIFDIKWIFNFIIWFFIDFINRFEGFWSFLGDIGPFLRPDLGEKLGDGYQLQIYINQGFLKPWGKFRAGLC